MTPAALLTLRVTFRDDTAAAGISPAAANAYLAAHGWRHFYETANLHVWGIHGTISQVLIPRVVGPDYGAVMSRVVNELAEHEERSALAVYAELVASAVASD